METTYIDKLAWVYLQDRRVLMARSKGKDTFYTPGGKREEGESDLEALMREVKEELTIDLMPGTVAHVATLEAPAHGKPEGTMVRNTFYQGTFEGEPRPAAEIEELEWFAYEDRERCSSVNQLLLEHLKGKDLID